MDDPSLIGIHRLKGYASLRPLHLIGDILCKIFQGFLPSLTVVFRIHLHADVIVTVPVHHEGDQILKRIQRLSSLTDQNTHIVSLEFDIHHLFFFIKANFHKDRHMHGRKNVVQKRPCLIFHGFLHLRLNSGRLRVKAQKSGGTLFHHFIFQPVAGHKKFLACCRNGIIHCLCSKFHEFHNFLQSTSDQISSSFQAYCCSRYKFLPCSPWP